MIIEFERRVVVTDVYVEVCEITCNEKFETEEEKLEWLQENHWDAHVEYDEWVDRQDSYSTGIEICS